MNSNKNLSPGKTTVNYDNHANYSMDKLGISILG